MEDGGSMPSARLASMLARMPTWTIGPCRRFPFAASSFSTDTVIGLTDDSSHVVYEEILSCGRVARGERFAYRDYRSHVRVTCSGTPVFIDNTIYRPTSTDMEGLGFLAPTRIWLIWCS